MGGTGDRPQRAPKRAMRGLITAPHLRVIACGLILLALSTSVDTKEPPRDSLSDVIASSPDGGDDGAVSPDGSTVLASLQREGHWHLWTFSKVRQRWSQLTSGGSDDFEGQWSPDGTRIAYTSVREGHKNIWLYVIRSGAVKQLTFGRGDEEYPAWKPDSS